MKIGCQRKRGEITHGALASARVALALGAISVSGGYGENSGGGISAATKWRWRGWRLSAAAAISVAWVSVSWRWRGIKLAGVAALAGVAHGVAVWLNGVSMYYQS